MKRTDNTPPSKKNLNIEILKVLSMFMVVVWHFYVHGLKIDHTEIQPGSVSTLNFGISQLIIVICSVCVNLFVLVTGFFLINKSFKTIRFVRIWFQTVFYSVTIDLVLYATNSETNLISNIWTDIMPICNNTYWFVRQYLRLIIIAPIISFYLLRLTKTIHHLIMIIILVIVLFLTIRNPFCDGRYISGYSILWFVMLFYTGGYLHIYETSNKWTISTKIFCILLFLTWAYTIFVLVYKHLYNSDILHNTTYEYNTFPYFLSVILFIIIKRSNLNGKRNLNIFYDIAPLTFGVYLIHDNNKIRTLIWDQIYSWGALYDSLLLTPTAICISCIIFTICISIDYLRKELFRVLRIDILINLFSKFIDSILIKIWNKISGILKITTNS